jgi:hypothetical protein
VAQETVQNMVHKSSKTMTTHEARQILGINENTPWEEVLKVGVEMTFVVNFSKLIYAAVS